MSTKKKSRCYAARQAIRGGVSGEERGVAVTVVSPTILDDVLERKCQIAGDVVAARNLN